MPGLRAATLHPDGPSGKLHHYARDSGGTVVGVAAPQSSLYMRHPRSAPTPKQQPEGETRFTGAMGQPAGGGGGGAGSGMTMPNGRVIPG
ncbi:hypothetical protein IFM12275_17850 [Nocardia sputorum]|uniref:Uncharacterized protein n=1 Tax=Nocardia sputorum TaxID=2984338 RepID=A0ABM8CZ80_9NOCA|nr:hypothetical protein IFM12275_17850 [Nocardia sputorum]BDU00338.1 hypothetical protein IFM12276_33660 [Nocardia sputorum]